MKRRKTGVRVVSMLLMVAMVFSLVPGMVGTVEAESVVLPIDQTTEFDFATDFQKHLEKIEAFRLFVENKSSNEKEITDGDFFKKEYAIEFFNKMVISGEIRGLPLLDPDMQYVPDVLSSIAVRRAELWLAAFAVGAAFPNASYFFRHSLQDNPPDMYLFNHPVMVPIRNNRAYEERILAIRRHLRYFPSYSRVAGITFCFWNGMDMHLTLNRARMGARSLRNLNRLDITITDLYNFEWAGTLGYGVGVVRWAVTIINNAAVDAQRDGVVVPYNITIFQTYRDIEWMPLW